MKEKAPRGLTPLMGRFVVEYVVDLNGTQAAIRAGYSSRGAEVTASRLLRIPKVAAAVQEAQRAANAAHAAANATRQVNREITRERVLTELDLLAFSDVTQFEVADGGGVQAKPDAPPGAVRAISSVKMRRITDSEGGVTQEVEFRLWDKPGALKLAGRHVDVKGFADRTELTGPNGGPLALSVNDPRSMTTEEREREITQLLAAATTTATTPAQEPPASQAPPDDGAA